MRTIEKLRIIAIEMNLQQVKLKEINKTINEKDHFIFYHQKYNNVYKWFLNIHLLENLTLCQFKRVSGPFFSIVKYVLYTMSMIHKYVLVYSLIHQQVQILSAYPH